MGHCMSTPQQETPNQETNHLDLEIPNQEANQANHRTVTIKIDSCGNHCFGGGTRWEEKFPGVVDGIIVSHGTSSVRSIQMIYDNVQGGEKLVTSKRHGGGGKQHVEIQFEHEEYITGVNGLLSYWSKNVKSISFVTNFGRCFGPYGEKEGRGVPFRFEFNGCINGFHGRSSDSRLKALGVYVKIVAAQVLPPAAEAVPETSMGTDATQGEEVATATTTTTVAT